MRDDTKGESGHKDEGRREWLVGAPLAANHDRVWGRGGLAVRSHLHTQSAALEGTGAVASGWSRTSLYLLPCPFPHSRPRYGMLLLSRSCSHSQDPSSRVPAVQGVRPEEGWLVLRPTPRCQGFGSLPPGVVFGLLLSGLWGLFLELPTGCLLGALLDSPSWPVPRGQGRSDEGPLVAF